MKSQPQTGRSPSLGATGGMTAAVLDQWSKLSSHLQRSTGVWRKESLLSGGRYQTDERAGWPRHAPVSLPRLPPQDLLTNWPKSGCLPELVSSTAATQLASPQLWAELGAAYTLRCLRFGTNTIAPQGSNLPEILPGLGGTITHKESLAEKAP